MPPRRGSPGAVRPRRIGVIAAVAVAALVLGALALVGPRLWRVKAAAVATPPPPTPAPTPPALHWSSQSEEEWLVGEVARDVLEMAVHAHEASTEAKARSCSVTVASLPGAAASYEVAAPIGDEGSPFRHRIVLYDHVWSATNYEALARLALDRLHVKASTAPSDRPGRGLAALVELTPDALVRENARVSDRLARDMASAPPTRKPPSSWGPSRGARTPAPSPTPAPCSAASRRISRSRERCAPRPTSAPTGSTHAWCKPPCWVGSRRRSGDRAPAERLHDGRSTCVASGSRDAQHRGLAAGLPHGWGFLAREGRIRPSPQEKPGRLEGPRVPHRPSLEAGTRMGSHRTRRALHAARSWVHGGGRERVRPSGRGSRDGRVGLGVAVADRRSRKARRRACPPQSGRRSMRVSSRRPGGGATRDRSRSLGGLCAAARPLGASRDGDLPREGGRGEGGRGPVPRGDDQGVRGPHPLSPSARAVASAAAPAAAGGLRAQGRSRLGTLPEGARTGAPASGSRLPDRLGQPRRPMPSRPGREGSRRSQALVHDRTPARHPLRRRAPFLPADPRVLAGTDRESRQARSLRSHPRLLAGEPASRGGQDHAGGVRRALRVGGAPTTRRPSGSRPPESR